MDTTPPIAPKLVSSANTSSSSPVHLELVGYLRGDAVRLTYFTSLAAASGLKLTQFGVCGASVHSAELQYYPVTCRLQLT